MSRDPSARPSAPPARDPASTGPGPLAVDRTAGAPDQPARRAFLRTAGVLGTGALAAQILPGDAGAQTPPATQPAPAPEPPQPAPEPGKTAADLVVETLIAWQVPFVFGMVGDGINAIVEALRKRQDKIRFVPVRHEEAAAFMASGYAKHTGKLGVCLATTGPGAVHLMNGLYDACFDSAPVLAITGTTFHDLIGTRFMQSVDTVSLMKDVALYNTPVTSPGHALVVANLACRAALAGRGVAHITIPKDVQPMRLAEDKPSAENHGIRTTASWLPPVTVPGQELLRAAADLLNAGKRIAILAGQGALGARRELEQVADRLGAPVAKALLGKAVLADDSPFTTGGIGHLGTQPSQQAMQECDTLLIVGSTMPWIDSYPKPGQARAVQIDRNASRIGLRYPVELGLEGDAKATLTALLPLLQQQSDRSFLSTAQSRVRDWRALLQRLESRDQVPLKPQFVMRVLSNILPEDAIISLDCGANTHFAARHIDVKAGQQLTGTGLLATMGPGLPFAIAARLAFPQRLSVAVVGDGGFAMLMAELSTAVKLELPVKIVLLKNNSLAEVMFEQRGLGNPVFGCDLGPIDFVKLAEACGAEGYRCARPGEVRPVLEAALRSPRPALIEAVVDAEEAPLKPGDLKV